jgi:hypothetical protein
MVNVLVVSFNLKSCQNHFCCGMVSEICTPKPFWCGMVWEICTQKPLDVLNHAKTIRCT